VKKVLCVDDTPILLNVLSEMLKAEGYEVTAVTGGMDCLDVLRKGEFVPDIILLDIMMSPMDGWETLSLIRDDPRFTMPVLMLTGKYPTMEEVNQYGILSDGYLMKPFALESLAGEVDAALRRTVERDQVIASATAKGMDERMIADYRKLSSMRFVIDQFEKIITDGTFTRESFTDAKRRLESIEKCLIQVGVIDP